MSFKNNVPFEVISIVTNLYRHFCVTRLCVFKYSMMTQYGVAHALESLIGHFRSRGLPYMEGEEKSVVTGK